MKLPDLRGLCFDFGYEDKIKGRSTSEMDLSKLVLACLGLQAEDVEIQACSMDLQHLQASVTIRQRRETCVCPKCKSPIYGVKQWKRKILWGAPLGALLQVRVILYQLQGACGECLQTRLAEAQFIHPRLRTMTTAFAEVCGRWMEETTIAAVERMTGCSGMSLWRLDQWRMQKMKAEFTLPKGLPIKLASADEVHMMTVRPKKHRSDKGAWNRKFITNLVSYDLSKVVANASGRNAQSLQKCLEQLSPELREKIKFLAVDMHDGFIETAQKLCPNASVAVDRFHVAQKLNEAFDEVRKSEFERAKKEHDTFQKEMLMPSKRFILMERKKDLAPEDQDRLSKLRALNENIHTGMLLIEYFHQVLDRDDVKGFREGLKDWERLIRKSGLKPFTKFLKTVHKYQDRIEVYIQSHLTTAVSEGINNKIKVLKRVGYTYTNQRSFKNKILQRCGLINSRYVDTKKWFWHVP
jgi:transposase